MVVAPGICTIQADQAGNTNYLPAPAIQLSFTIGLEAQSITFGALASVTYGAAPFTIKSHGFVRSAGDLPHRPSDRLYDCGRSGDGPRPG